MMYSSTSAGPWLWLHIHWLFLGLALFGFVTALLWLNKHASKKDFLKVVWASLGLGILGMLLTAQLAMAGWYQMVDGHNGYEWANSEMEEMMYFDNEDNE
ncbi:MAG: ABC-type Fe3+ transport system permease subunit [Oceanicoccus sp.]|jgi:ABC-type Fe3+ transport system permease subunit